MAVKKKATKKQTTARKTAASRKSPARKKVTTQRKLTTTRKKTTKQATAKKSTAKRAATKRKTVRKAPTRKAAVKKTAVKAAVSAPKLTKVSAAFKKTQIISRLVETTGLTKKDITNVLESLGEMIHVHVQKGSCGQFTLPGLLKIEVKVKPARKARKGINPFTGEEMMFKAKPATRVVKVKALKNLKDSAK